MRAQAVRNGGLLVEIVEGLLLAFVAVSTAWSGYQSALSSSRSAAAYGLSTKLRLESTAAQTTAGQQMLYDASTFNAWLGAEQAGNADLAALLLRRFRPEYRVAFDSWLRTDPLHNPDAPAGPMFMPEYRNAMSDRAAALDRQSTAALDAGTHARDVADDYVRVTVLLAVVLFLTALSQRFRIQNVRVGIISVALLVLGYSLFSLATVSA